MAYLAVVAVFFATPPGPSQLLMIANSLTHGLRRSVATVAGDLSANALQMTAAAFGLAAAIAQSAALLSAIKWAGVAYLIWLGIGKLLSRRAPHGADAAARGRPALLYRQGFLTSAANPIPLLRERFRMILSRPENAPPQMNRMLEVSTCRNSC